MVQPGDTYLQGMEGKPGFPAWSISQSNTCPSGLPLIQAVFVGSQRGATKDRLEPPVPAEKLTHEGCLSSSSWQSW